MLVRLLRHATLLLDFVTARILVDPMLSTAGAMEPVLNAANSNRIPLVDLPLSDAELASLFKTTNGILVTHVHRDHWDKRAAELVPKDTRVLCQAGDEETFVQAGFQYVTPITTEHEWRGIRFYRIDGEHGTGEIGDRMGKVSGFVLKSAADPTLYIAGDTIFCPPVGDALRVYQPDAVVVNAGAAQFLDGGPITMTAEDVASVCRTAPWARVIAVHMEAVNHCSLMRGGLREYLAGQGLANRVEIPADGESIEIPQSVTLPDPLNTIGT